MQSELHNTTSPNLRIATENLTDLRADHHARPDTRRFAAIFPLKVPEAAVSVDSSHTTTEEHSNSDDLLRFKSTSTTQVPSTSSVDEGSTLSAAQQVIACYRAIHGSDDAAECAMMEKRLPQIPDDQRSMYTLATSADTHPTMDMMWKPKPKVHMHHTDQLALMQAQSQAIAMMHDAGLKPTNKIQCRRRGCADILLNVQALKYHLHIHNIADSAGQCSDPSLATTCRHPLPECGISSPKGLRRSHARSKSSQGTRLRSPTTYALPRKLSAGTLPPSLFSPRETAPDPAQVPSFTTVAKAFTPNPSPNKRTISLPVPNDETPSTLVSTTSRGRRMKKENVVVSVGTEHNPRIAMLLSPPSSPITRGCLVPAKPSVPVAFGLARDTESNNDIPFSNETAHFASEQVTGLRSPVRALSPTRAMSPIRNGIKRILTIVNVTDQ